MNITLTKTTLFVSEILSRITGNTDEANAIKIARKALSNIQGQIAGLNAKQVDLEIKVEDAKDALSNAIYPTTMDEAEGAVYARNIQQADTALKQAEAELAAVLEGKEFFQQILEEKFGEAKEA